MKTITAVYLSENDNCATLASPAEKGDAVTCAKNEAVKTVTARENIPIWHKIAVNPIAQGEGVYKYGALIGTATENIEPGDHIHIHNTRSPCPGRPKL